MSFMPIQKPGRSEQTVCTPRDLLDAVERRFGKMDFDLAATAENNVVGDPTGDSHFGPGSMFAVDALASWADWDIAGNLWLNPPFGNIAPWAKKCAETPLNEDRRIFLLVPLTTANWACDYVHGRALVLGLNPRVTFMGHRTAFPKDLMLAVYGELDTGLKPWRWKEGA